MPFVIIRGNINGQIRHGISCSALPSKKGNLSNLSSSLLPSSLLPIIITNLVLIMMMKTKMMGAVDDKYACDDVEGWPQRCESHGSWEGGWVGVNIHTRS